MSRTNRQTVNGWRLAALSVCAWVWLTAADSLAADISCISVWGNSAASVEEPFAQQFPSGRRPSERTCRTILIRGSIESGDAKKFTEILRQNHPFVESVDIASAGGSVEEAIKIGRMIRRYLLMTKSPMMLPHSAAGTGELHESDGLGTRKTICTGPRCHCASACFLVWAAGRHRCGKALGVHAPSIKSTAFSMLPPDRAANLYRELLAEIGRYLEEMDIPRKYRDLMSDTSLSDMRWLTFDEADALVDPASIRTWIAASCETMSKEEFDAYLDLELPIPGSVTHFENRSPQDQLMYEVLKKKFQETATCERGRVLRARDAIKQVDD